MMLCLRIIVINIDSQISRLDQEFFWLIELKCIPFIRVFEGIGNVLQISCPTNVGGTVNIIL